MKHYAIIGGGPRGLFALESLFTALYNNAPEAQIKVTLFEPFKYPGAGWVWNPEQVESNWLNITERALQDLPGRPEIKLGDDIIPAFPSYTEWLPEEQQNPPATHPDQFPPRAKMGTYLNARFETITSALKGFDLLNLVEETVTKLTYIAPVFTAITKNTSVTAIDEVVLTIGHQDTELSEQLQEWKDHVAQTDNALLFTEAYPVEKMINANITSESVVAFRGFGLAMIDQIRALTLQRGAHFEILDNDTKEVAFQAGENHPQRFVPFSLDGLPMVPKPINKAVDKWFMPSDDAINAFAKAIHKGACGDHPAKDQYFLLEAMATVVAPLFLKLGDKATQHDLTEEEIYFLTINYLNNKSLAHPLLLSHQKPVLQMMQQQVEMAVGEAPVSLDYFIGQVWRHCQPSIYREFSYPASADDVVAEVIALDEASKRYSYGPPVESIQQLIALAKAGLLDLGFVNNPEITCVDGGWQLESDGNKITVDIMLNAVLDSPQLVTVDTPIIKNLLSNKMIEPKHTDLGIRTDDYGYVEVPEGKSFVPLAVLGRLSKGSVIGVDAILECFGPRTISWSERSIALMKNEK
ncbi:FAD/NAD(P)-binding protein [Dokdonia sp. PRO95]|uniref:FAD/NAD(P)-binding protein n=1 Tax=Dokdonia sp. PRO95 TaxID=1239415 RepID=UPI00068F61D2|nr:FAD/NAD(P)-binding protein [Dokdonia sp. PRO95]